MRLYITGGSGYLGSMLVQLATANGWHVRYSVFQHGSATDGHADVVDLRKRGELSEALNTFKPDAVIHTAYVQHDPDMHAITVLGAIEAAAASARGVLRVPGERGVRPRSRSGIRHQRRCDPAEAFYACCADTPGCREAGRRSGVTPRTRP